MMDFKKFSYWSGGIEGKGCSPCQGDLNGLALDRVYNWEGWTKETPLPYICASRCAVGYAYRQNSKRCVQIVTDYFGLKTQSEATLSCAQDNGRLLSINSCTEFDGLKEDLWLKNPSVAQSYWVGFYVNGLDEYFHQYRTSEPQTGPISSRGEIGMQPGGDSSCSDNKKLPMINSVGSSISSFGSAPNGEFGKLTFPSDNEMKLELNDFSSADSTSTTSLCEKDQVWTCPTGYTLFLESCYKILSGELPAMDAALKCIQEEEAQLAEAPTTMHLKFLNTLAKSESLTNFWIAIRRHVTTVEASEDNSFLTYDDNTRTVASLAGAGATDDCVEYTVDATDVEVKPCDKNSSVICEAKPILTENTIYAIPAPKVLLPLDLTSGFEDLSKSITEYVPHNVAFTYQPSIKNSLNSAAHFMGTDNSYIDFLLEDNYFKNGMSVTAWIYIDQIVDQQIQYILDSRGPYLSATDAFNNFQLFVTKGRRSQITNHKPGTTVKDL